jgi:cytochrome c oxidase cbb3-type subunit 4
MDYATIHSIYTVIILVAFVALCVWVFLLKRRKDFDQAANLIFSDETKAPQKQQQENDHE